MLKIKIYQNYKILIKTKETNSEMIQKSEIQINHNQN